MKRRSFLYSLGLGAGAPLLQPFLRHAWAEETRSIPRRVVLVVEGNGVEPVNLLSQRSREALEAEVGEEVGDERVFHDLYTHSSPIEVTQAQLSDAPSLAPLAAQGDAPSLDAHAAVILGLSNRITGGGHSTNFGALSCAFARKLPVQATIDHVLAQMQTMRGEVPFDAIRMGYQASSRVRFAYQTCAAGPGKPLPIISDPTMAFNMLFGSVASAAGQKVFTDRRDLLNFARQNVNTTLREMPGNSLERQKLERYLESLEELTGQHMRIMDMAPQLQDVMPTSPSDDPELFETRDALTRFDIIGDLAAAALIGGLTNVMVLSAGSGYSGFNTHYTSINPEAPGRHSICHGSSKDPTYREILRRVTERHVEVVAKIARKLLATPEGDGTMLDHTAIVFMSDNGHQHHSNAKEWPKLVIGGRALGLKTDGRTIIYPTLGSDAHRQVSNFYNTLGHIAGVELNEFGQEAAQRIATGPLPEIYAI